jgi:putative ABC transport system substrate-binding protein
VVRTMNQRIFAFALGALIVALCLPAQAQEEKKIPWIGYLAGAGSSPNQAFVQGMRDLGYVEGKNIAFVYRTTEGRRERYPDIVNELVRLKVNVLVTDVTSAAVALKKATNTIPIVMMSSTDPVQTGLVALARVAILASYGSASGADEVFAKETQVPAQAMKVQLLRVGVQSPDDIERAFRTIIKERANGLLMRLQPSVYSAHYKRVAELTASSRLPSISNNISWVDAGGLMSYGSDLDFQYRRAATYVDKVLKGTKPADLPVEAPTKFELAISLKAAKQIGLTIPPNVLARADKVIK